MAIRQFEYTKTKLMSLWVDALKRTKQSPILRRLLRRATALLAMTAELLDLEHLGELHGEVQVTCELQLALHEGLHPVEFASKDFDIIG